MTDTNDCGRFPFALAGHKFLAGTPRRHRGAPGPNPGHHRFRLSLRRRRADGRATAAPRPATSSSPIGWRRSLRWTPLRSWPSRACPPRLSKWRACLQTSFEYYRRSQLQPLSLPARVRALARLLRENLPMTMQGIGMVVPLFAGVDHTVSPPAQARIYFYDPLGAQFQAVGYAASGSGSGTIRSMLSFQERHASPRPSQMGLARSRSFRARPTDHGVGIRFRHRRGQPGAESFATIKLLKPSGVETITDQQQKEFLHD